MKRTISMLLVLLTVLSCFSGITMAAEKTVAEPKVIATSADATSEAAVIEKPGDVKIWEPRKLTDAERTTLIQDVALAYFYQSNEVPHIQYDGRSVSKVAELSRPVDDGRPEDAWYDSTVYSVCSNYCWKIYHETYNHPLFRMTYARTRTWCDFPAGTPEVVVQYTGPDSTDSKGETDLAKAVADSRAKVQAGDIICYADKDSGHAMMFVGDLFGDGTDYILHCKGSSYSTDTFKDNREAPAQAIELMKADETVWGGEKAKWSLSRPAAVAKGFAILRPTLDPAFPELPTKEGMARLQFRRMKITRELDRYKFDSAVTGEEIPVYLTIENKGTAAYNEVPVEEYIPAGTTLVEGSQTKGARVEGSTIKWAVKIPAGKAITLTYKVKVTAGLGETIHFKGGLVGGIASRSTSLQVGGKPLSAEQNAAIFAHGKKLNGTKGAYRNLEAVNKFYDDALGLSVGLPKTVAGLLRKLTETKGDAVHRTGKLALDKMIIPLHFTGMYAHAASEWDQVRDHKEEFYKPGDVFIGLLGESIGSVKSNKDVDIMIYLGEDKLLCYDSKGAYTMAPCSSLFDYALKYNLLLGLRPTLAYEDLSKNTVKTMNFTDVKDSDWYYVSVKRMVETGVIAGMTETTFVPGGSLTWGQALKLIAVGLGEGEQPAGTHWASGYLALAKKKGWLTEDVDLNANITRLQFCQVAAKADNLTAQPSKNPFADTTSKEVLALYHAGVINGMTDTTFAPDQYLTRAQIAKIIAQLVNV